MKKRFIIAGAFILPTLMTCLTHADLPGMAPQTPGITINNLPIKVPKASKLLKASSSKREGLITNINIKINARADAEAIKHMWGGTDDQISHTGGSHTKEHTPNKMLSNAKGKKKVNHAPDDTNASSLQEEGMVADIEIKISTSAAGAVIKKIFAQHGIQADKHHQVAQKTSHEGKAVAEKEEGVIADIDVNVATTASADLLKKIFKGPLN